MNRTVKVSAVIAAAAILAFVGIGGPRFLVPTASADPLLPVGPGINIDLDGPAVDLNLDRELGMALDFVHRGEGATRPIPVPGHCAKKVTPATIQAAVDAAKPGDRFCVFGSSKDRIVVERTGAVQVPITITGDGRGTQAGITLDANNVTVENFNFAESAPGMDVLGNHLTLRNNTVTHPVGEDYDGVRFFGDDMKIYKNTISRITNTEEAHADCMQTFSSDTAPSQRVIIDNNRCEKTDNQCLIVEGPNDGEGDGIGHTSDIVFSRNFCEAGASQAVMLEDAQRVSIVLNDIRGDLDKAFAFDIGSTFGKVIANKIAPNISYEVGMDDTSRPGYIGPEPGGPP
ncbi:right-handed parallel beta-helix repeat-containing protein [Pseudonocardia spinosispora]|uniref:right-handed parallel beta-helix repeat-containing protein n=1 Tax=Pseudonocardia spinosispora TaxID=103441 RepID=UPI0004129DD3|nr:right-handed parallel beta-helix repeat-containing protein [Pseudonocardia spinosispora]